MLNAHVKYAKISTMRKFSHWDYRLFHDWSVKEFQMMDTAYWGGGRGSLHSYAWYWNGAIPMKLSCMFCWEFAQHEWCLEPYVTAIGMLYPWYLNICWKSPKVLFYSGFYIYKLLGEGGLKHKFWHLYVILHTSTVKRCIVVDGGGGYKSE